MDAAPAQEAKNTDLTETPPDSPGVRYIANYISDQTLGEMGGQDRDNFDYLMQNKTYIRRFKGFTQNQSMDMAMQYFGAVMDKILRSHGFKMTKAMMKNHKIVDVVLEQKFRLRIETRLYPPEEEVYQTGVYILKLRKGGDGDMIDHEIVGFISEPFQYRDPDSKLVVFNPEICIRTTEKL